MESSSNLFGMPSQQNRGGFKLRKGQEKLGEFVAKNLGIGLINVQFPTGYGKTVAFAVAYQQYRESGIANRALVVVPTRSQRRQYERDFSKACSKIGLDIAGVKRVDCDESTLKYHRTNQAEIFVIGVGKLLQNLGYMHDLMAKGRWFLVADEHHHYGEDMPWGDAVKELMKLAERTLAMSATPYRNGGDLSIFGKPTDGLSITLGEAYEEEAIKRIKANIEHYFVDVVDMNGELTRITTESLRINETLPSTLSAWETKQQLRYLNKYLSPMLSSAVACLTRKQIELPGEHQMIVYAMSCRHAQSLAKTIYEVGLKELSVDWVGVGPDGRIDQENDAVIDAFKEGKIDCLVQVNKAGEGFDVSRASVLVFLNLLGSSPQAEQQIGRGLRRNYAIRNHKDDICDIFVPADSDLVDLVRGLQELTTPEPEKGKDKEDRESAENVFRLESLPSWQLINAEHDRSEVLWVIEPNDPRVYQVAKQMEKANNAKGKRFNAQDKAFLEDVAQAMTAIMRQEHQAQSEDDMLTQAKKSTARAVNVCANNYVKIRAKQSGGSYERTLSGDVIKRIHGYWKSRHCGHDAMTLTEAREKYDWVNALNNSLRGGEIPVWLNI